MLIDDTYGTNFADEERLESVAQLAQERIQLTQASMMEKVLSV